MTPTRYEDTVEGYWQTKVLIKDKKRSKSYIIHMNMNARIDKNLRLDVMTQFGTHLASLVLNQDKVKYLVVRQKRFYKGQSTPHALKPLISMPLDPKLIYNILFDKPITRKDWKCKQSIDKFLESCKSEKEKLSLNWTGRMMHRKTVHIDHPTANLQINFFSYNQTLQKKKNLFKLNPPKNFKVLNIH